MEKLEEGRASFHQIRRGQCRVVSGEQEEIAGPGDIIFVPHGDAHVLSSVDSPSTIRAGDFPTFILCGYFQFDQAVKHPLLATLPPLLVVRAEVLEQNLGLKNTMDLLADEFVHASPGSELLLDKLSEVMLIQFFRTHWIRESHPGFLQALFDTQTSRALQRIHADPANPWTLETLAAEIGMSRTALANRFKSMVGVTMFEYLTKVRMQRACKLLATTTLPLYLIAERSGYVSEVSFSKAFKSLVGTSPGRYRKRAR